MDLAAKAVRFLAVDSIAKAGSGHPGLPLGMADIGIVLWKNFLRVNPNNPTFFNRDRFVLSNGHGSILLYVLMHLSGFPLSIEDLKNFRQLGSLTPGHPEYNPKLGIETTTGPLGQGFANAVGMALAEKWLAQEFNRPNFNIVDHYTYVFVGDGCLMEGISHEAASLAGTHRLNKLILFWDNNGISIDGEVINWCKDDTNKRFTSYGWKVYQVNGYDQSAIKRVIKKAQRSNQPVLISCRTQIGYGSPKVGKASAHGAPLTEEEISNMRKTLDWNYPPFTIPKEVYLSMDLKSKGDKIEHAWEVLLREYKLRYPELAQLFLNRREDLTVSVMKDFTSHLIQVNNNQKIMATREASQKELNYWSTKLPNLLGGSADLTPSNLTYPTEAQELLPETIKVPNKMGYFHYGVREFGMFAIMNGIALHKGYLPYGGSFLVFSGYGENAIRMAAMMKLKVIFVFTHDSIGLGDDGPTHQPIEQLTALRAIPNLRVIRPANNVETAVAWKAALDYHGPSVLVLSRQKVFAPFYSEIQLTNIDRGGYIFWENSAQAELILVTSGSELGLAYETAQLLATRHSKKVRVVSIWSQEIFDQQTNSYRTTVLLPKSQRVAIEAGSGLSWHKYLKGGLVIGMESFGKSAPAKLLFEHFGFTPEKIIVRILNNKFGE